MTFMWMVMKINLIWMQTLAGNFLHYSSSTDRTHIWRILICGHVCPHVHASGSFIFQWYNPLYWPVMQPKMNGMSSKQFGWTKEQVNIPSYKWLQKVALLKTLPSTCLLWREIQKTLYFSFHVSSFFFPWNKLTYDITEIADAKAIY